MSNETDPVLTGCIGSVARGETDVSPNAWAWTVPRNKWLDFGQNILDRQYYLYFNLKATGMDLALFRRPFKDDAWLAIIANSAMIITVLVLYHNCTPMTGSDAYSVRILGRAQWSYS